MANIGKVFALGQVKRRRKTPPLLHFETKMSLTFQNGTILQYQQKYDRRVIPTAPTHYPPPENKLPEAFRPSATTSPSLFYVLRGIWRFRRQPVQFLTFCYVYRIEFLRHHGGWKSHAPGYRTEVFERRTTMTGLQHRYELTGQTRL